MKPAAAPFCALALLLAAGSAGAVSCGTESPPLPGQAPRSEGPARGALLMVGGGEIGPHLLAEMAHLAGGAAARWVVIVTAASDDEVPGLSQVNSVTALGQPQTVLHTRDPREANRPTFTAPIDHATAVWFEGGRQSRLVDAYRDTRTAASLRALLDRGGLIAGTSAGATIQGSQMVRAAGRGTITPPPQYNRGLGFVSNLAVDQHIDARHRELDLAPLVADHPGLLGLGLDEATGVVVQGDTLRVVGAGRVLVNDGAPHGDAPFWCLHEGDRFDLATWTRLPGGTAP